MKFHIDFTASDTPPLENALEMDGWFCIVLFCFALLYISCSVVSTAIKKMLAFVLFCMYQVLSVLHLLIRKWLSRLFCSLLIFSVLFNVILREGNMHCEPNSLHY